MGSGHLVLFMELYLVRHGQTSGNVSKRHQPPNIPLTTAGRLQAEATAQKIAAMKPTHLLVSPKKRAVESAGAIAAATGLTPQIHPIFSELQHPYFLQGEHHFSWAGVRYIWGWFWGNDDVTFNDGETLKGLWSRVGEAYGLIESFPEDAKVVVVSHSVFISFMLAGRRRQKKLSLLAAPFTLLQILFYKNSGVRFLKGKRKAVSSRTSTPESTPRYRWHLRRFG